MLRRCALAVLLACSSSLAQSLQDSIPPLLPDSQDTVSREIRAARARLWDLSPRSGFPSLLTPPRVPFGAPPPPAPAGAIVDLTPLPELPLDESDVVLVGEVTNVQPFLTSSQRSLYTEYTIRILERVKSNVPVKDSFVLLQMGGKARLETGRVIEWPVRGQGDPILSGRQYLLFLRYMAALDAYDLVKMWHVEDAVIKAALPVEQAKARNFQSENDGRLLTDVIAYIKEKLKK